MPTMADSKLRRVAETDRAMRKVDGVEGEGADGWRVRRGSFCERCKYRECEADSDLGC